MRLRPYVLALASLAACDAGHERPGSDNELSRTGPSLRIATPRDGLVTAPGDVLVMFDARDVERAGDGAHGHSVRAWLDDELDQTVPDTTKPLRLTGLVEGTHVLRAVLVGPDGVALRNPAAYAAVTFSVERADGRWFWRTPEGRGAQASPATDPGILAALVTNDGRPSLDVFAHGCPEGPSACRLRIAIDGGEPKEIRPDAARPQTLEGLADGDHEVVVELWTSAGEGKPLAPVPGRPFGLVKRTFRVAHGVK